jgi:AraC family L-rhamnose operon transcriptional activator RhaR
MAVARPVPPGPALPPAPQSLYRFEDCTSRRDCQVFALSNRDYAIGLHEHDFFEINVVRRGTGWHFIKGARFAVGKGDVFVIPPGVRHGYRNGGGLDVDHLILRPAVLARAHGDLARLRDFVLLFQVEPRLRSDGGFSHFLRLEPAQDRAVDELLDRLLAEAAMADPESTLLLEQIGLVLIVLLCRFYRDNYLRSAREGGIAEGPFRALSQALEHIHARYMEPIAVPALARRAGLSKPTFNRLFRRATGTSPLRYIQAHRIAVARRLLSETPMTLVEIAHATGFYDSAHFARTFRALAGTTPSTLRRRDPAAGW